MPDDRIEVRLMVFLSGGYAQNVDACTFQKYRCPNGQTQIQIIALSIFRADEYRANVELIAESLRFYETQTDWFFDNPPVVHRIQHSP